MSGRTDRQMNILLLLYEDLFYFSMEQGGVLWFENLTMIDPFYALPVFTSLSLYLQVNIFEIFIRCFTPSLYGKGVQKNSLKLPQDI